MKPSPSALSLQDVTLRYGEAVAVDALCLEVAGGEIFGLLGPNGCGKSTTLSAVAGARTPDAGVIRVAGLRERDDPVGYRRRLGLVPQELAFYEDLSASDNLTFFGRLYGLGGRVLRRRVEAALELVRLGGRARCSPRTFSGGMQRRLNLACALLHKPLLLLLDEPTVGLDVQSREAVFAALRELRDEGCAVVFTTHHLAEAEQLCDRVGIMDRGRLIGAGAVGELFAALPTPYHAEGERPVVLDAETRAALQALLPADVALEIENGRLKLRPQGVEPEAACPGDRTTQTPARLERIFLAMTGRSLSKP